MKASCLWKFWATGALVCASARQSLPTGFDSALSIPMPFLPVASSRVPRGDTLLRMRGGAEFNPYDPATYYESYDNAGTGGTTYEQLGAPAAQAAESNQQDSERKQELIRQFREAVSEFFLVL